MSEHFPEVTRPTPFDGELPERFLRDDMRYLINERGNACGLVHVPTGTLFTLTGQMSSPRRPLTVARAGTDTRTLTNKAHAERVRAADRMGLVPSAAQEEAVSP